jgi:hypothetical protein
MGTLLGGEVNCNRDFAAGKRVGAKNHETVGCSETGTEVTLLPIKDDLRERTLAKIPGLLGKLGYLAELRESGAYVHWGLTRVYGEEGTQRTLADLHRALFLQVLRTPLRRLVDDAKRAAASQHCEVRAYLKELLRDPSALVPANMGGGSAAHFNSVVAALLSVLQ